MISRRSLVGAFPTLAVGASGPRSRTDVAPGPYPPRAHADRALTAAFLRNAYGFCDSSHDARARFPAQSLYTLAIATELGLKAYLLRQGVSDDWNRVHIGHDLSKALSCAQRAGFQDAPPGLAALAAALSPCYMAHGFRTAPELRADASPPRPHAIVRTLLDRVSEAIR